MSDRWFTGTLVRQPYTSAHDRPHLYFRLPCLWVKKANGFEQHYAPLGFDLNTKLYVGSNQISSAVNAVVRSRQSGQPSAFAHAQNSDVLLAMKRRSTATVPLF